ncbi:MAG: hypothetical protein Q8P62_00060 [Candidatus Peregrinibacteria bacterium]|nr:hypothetical protein [Candidatus Peregrinibacteria bacterium]
MNNTKISSMPDENLYNLCKTYGERTRIWRQRFAGLLPEVFKRKLYEKKGFCSIFEFAKKLAGMNEEQVRCVINVEKRFEDMPALKMLLTSGKVSINKLSRIVSIAKPENEIFLATQVQILSKSAVETLVRDEKFAEENKDGESTENAENFGNIIMDFEYQNGEQKSFLAPKSLPGQMCFDTKNEKSNEQNYPKIIFGNEKITDKKTEFETLEISPEVQKKLLELQEKGIDINELLKEFLQKREEEIAQRKAEINEELARKEQEKQEKQKNSWQDNSENSTKNLPINSPTNIPQTALPASGSAKHQKSASPSPSRHIPISIKRILYAEYGTKCSIKNCKKLSEQIHHTQRFSAVPSHDPRYLAPLCKAHHELMHSRDIDYIEIRKKVC